MTLLLLLLYNNQKKKKKKRDSFLDVIELIKKGIKSQVTLLHHACEY